MPTILIDALEDFDETKRAESKKNEAQYYVTGEMVHYYPAGPFGITPVSGQLLNALSPQMQRQLLRGDRRVVDGRSMGVWLLN